MSDIIRFSLRDDVLAKLRATLPSLTSADLDAFDALVAQDHLVTDDGAPHSALVAWVQRILDRRSGGAVPVPVSPVPKTGPAGVEVVA